MDTVLPVITPSSCNSTLVVLWLLIQEKLMWSYIKRIHWTLRLTKPQGLRSHPHPSTNQPCSPVSSQSSPSSSQPSQHHSPNAPLPVQRTVNPQVHSRSARTSGALTLALVHKTLPWIVRMAMLYRGLRSIPGRIMIIMLRAVCASFFTTYLKHNLIYILLRRER